MNIGIHTIEKGGIDVYVMLRLHVAYVFILISLRFHFILTFV